MPYVYYDELPDGATEVDVVPRADYDSVVSERDATAQQRDEALGQIEEARREVRDAKAQYADAILSANRKPKLPEQPKANLVKTTLAMSTKELFD